MMSSHFLLTVLILGFYVGGVRSLQLPSSSSARSAVRQNNNVGAGDISRRSMLFEPMKRALIPAALIVSTATTLPNPSYAAKPNGLPLNTAPSSGLKWADAKIGPPGGQPVQNGDITTIDYSMASTAGRFPQIYTTKDKGTPYRWKMGDGSTISGIEKAILGSEEDGIPPMLPGGIRRVIVPANLGYEALREPNAKCEEGREGAIGPIPPKDDIGAYQRWGQFYCNPRIPYQPDLVLDIKLYGGKKASS